MGLIKAAKVPRSASPFSMLDIENHARSLILRARQQADQLLAAAQQEAENLKKQMHQQGFVEGRAKGLAEGTEGGRKSGHDQALNENRQKLTDLIKSLTLAVQSMEQSRQELESDGLREVVLLAIAVAQRVTKRMGIIDPLVLQANLAEAMKLVMHQSDVRLVLNPGQKAELEAVLPKLKMQWPEVQHIDVCEDAGILPGGCRVMTRQGQIDADLQEQLDRVVAELLPGAPAGGA